jgi:hypothetical protein
MYATLQVREKEQWGACGREGACERASERASERVSVRE